MKRLLKWLIPCLVACFMVVGLVQTASFTFANEEDQTEETIESEDENTVPDDENTTGDSGEGEIEDDQQKKDDEDTQNQTEDSKDLIDPIPSVMSLLSLNGTGGVSTFDATSDEEVNYKKWITKESGVDSYNLHLNFKGKTTGTSVRPKIDVLLVVDDSGSMSDYGKLGSLKNAILGTKYRDRPQIKYHDDGLVNSILGNRSIDAQMSIVKYSDDSRVVQDWISNYNSVTGNYEENCISTFRNNVERELHADGATNPMAGLIKAKQQLKKSRSGAEKFVIFLTDGEPTYYYGSGYNEKPVKTENLSLTQTQITGYSRVTGNDNVPCKNFYYGKDNANDSIDSINVYRKIDNEYYEYNYDESKTNTAGTGGDFNIVGAMFAKICADSIIQSGIKTSNFYSIGYGSAATSGQCKEFLEEMPGTYVPASKADDIKKVFNSITEAILKHEVSELTITDTLSEYVEFNLADNSDVKLFVTDTETGASVTEEEAKIKLETNVNKDTGTVSAKIVNVDGTAYTLNSDYTYEICFPVKVSEAAYQSYLKNKEYPHVDDEENQGFYSNADNGATANYSFMGNSIDVVYQEKPVVTIDTVDVKVTKDVDGSFADMKKEFGFEYKFTSHGVEIKDEFTLKDKDSYESNEDNYFIIEKIPLNTEVTINETDADGYKLTCSQKDVTVDDDKKEAKYTTTSTEDQTISLVNTREAVPLTGITDNTPKGLGLIGSIVVEIAAIAFVLKKKRQLKM
ncbi:MAG: VWA domain-containing protein, partial [Floccifex porci]|uniref:DUF7604 domain-containing protein n=1 Tax=Floccifex porci TaxID=2606629 RepID=UPI003F10856E